MSKPNQDYINTAYAAANLLENESITTARILLEHFLAVSQHIEAALADYVPTDPRLDLFRRRGPDALALLNGQLEDTAAQELRTAAAFLEEMNNS